MSEENHRIFGSGLVKTKVLGLSDNEYFVLQACKSL